MLERLDTDILVIGSGGAGLLAALHGLKAVPELDITIAAKGLIGKSGCTRMVQGGYNAALGRDDSVERHLMDAIQGGMWLPHQAMALKLCETAPLRILELENEYGCYFDRDPDGNLQQRAFAGQSFDRTVHKGGLFGTDYRMLFPSDGLQGIKRFYLDSLVAFGKRGLACQPAIIGIGLGGSKDTCMVLGKRAACLRVVGDRNPDPGIAELELEFAELGNSIGMGAMGFVGKSMVVDCHIEVGYCHTGGMQMSVHAFCLSSRRACARVHADGTVEFRTDPKWFTEYQRRETVGWPVSPRSDASI